MTQINGDAIVYRPSLLPDDRALVWYPLAICGILTTTGCVLGIALLAIIPLFVAALFPGMPILIHGIYHISVRITICGDALTIIDRAGDPFVSYPRRQEISLNRVVYAYHLGREAKENKGKTRPPEPFCNTRLKIEKYRAADADGRRAGTVARTNNGLVLSDHKGDRKIYLMHFHDLSQTDWQSLARAIVARNSSVTLIMSDREKNAFLGPAD